MIRNTHFTALVQESLSNVTRVRTRTRITNKPPPQQILGNLFPELPLYIIYNVPFSRTKTTKKKCKTHKEIASMAYMQGKEYVGLTRQRL